MSIHLVEGCSKRIWCQNFKNFNFRQISKNIFFHFREPTTTYLASNVGGHLSMLWCPYYTGAYLAVLRAQESVSDGQHEHRHPYDITIIHFRALLLPLQTDCGF